MQKYKSCIIITLSLSLIGISPTVSTAWHDETHLAIAKVAGYYKWYNAAGADIAKVKAGKIESHNHYRNNPPGTVITPEMVLAQVDKYNQLDRDGHLYGAIIASLRDYIEYKKKGKYSEYHLAYCIHYIGDLSQPLENTVYNAFNKKHHGDFDGIINDKVLTNLQKIRIYPINIHTEKDLTWEIARIANLAMTLGYTLEKENRMLTEEETYIQLGHSASLVKAILEYLKETIAGR